MKSNYDVFLICPVRNADENQKLKMEEHINSIKNSGKTIYYPATDTNQVDETGFRICTDNMNAIKNSNEVHIFWDKNSQGSLFDLGVSFALNKKIVIINKDELIQSTGKSFTNMIIAWEKTV